MTNLAELALAAILSVARPPAVDAVAERPRLEEMARAIADAVEERDELAAWLHGAVAPLPFRGARAREATALAMVAIAVHESGFRADVADCRRTGDRLPWQRLNEGRSITVFQLLGGRAWGRHTRAELCASPRRAAARALAMFAAQGRCETPAAWFRGYARGSCDRDSAPARRQCAIWERLARRAGLKASCTRRGVE